VLRATYGLLLNSRFRNFEIPLDSGARTHHGGLFRSVFEFKLLIGIIRQTALATYSDSKLIVERSEKEKSII